eukprot:1393043-Prymnesium_polylepis.1
MLAVTSNACVPHSVSDFVMVTCPSNSSSRSDESAVASLIAYRGRGGNLEGACNINGSHGCFGVCRGWGPGGVRRLAGEASGGRCALCEAPLIHLSAQCGP